MQVVIVVNHLLRRYYVLGIVFLFVFCGFFFFSFTNMCANSQLCPTLCNPMGCSPPGSPVPGIFPARTLEWVAISFSNACKWKVKGKSVTQLCLTLIDPMDCSLPGSSVHGIFQAEVLEWGAIAFSNNCSYDSAILLLFIYPKEVETGYQSNIWTPMFIAALFTIAKKGKQS